MWWWWYYGAINGVSSGFAPFSSTVGSFQHVAMSTTSPAPSIRPTLGALEAGAFVGIFLSGIVTMQVYLYYKVYPKDKLYIKCLVALVWVLDFTHTVMICVANWLYLITHFGNTAEADHIAWSVAITIALTAVVTFLVHSFFTHRIYVLSRAKKFIAIPLVVLALFRLAAALVSTGEMIRLGSFDEFVRRFEWVFTMGLSSAVALDVSVTLCLSYYLRKSKTGFKTMNEIIDMLILYTVETGIITSATTIASLVCWVTMPHRLIFLGLHFTISKLYANTFLATLNSRATLRARSMSGSRSNPDPPSDPPLWHDPQRRASSGPRARTDADPLSSTHLRITVEKTITRGIDGDITNVNLHALNEESSPADDRSSYLHASRSGGPLL